VNATNDRPSLQVLERTFTILESFDEDRPEWSATEIARALDLPIPTVHRLLTALKHRGYVSQHEETKRFRLGVAALQLGDRARAVVDLRGVAMPALRRLAQDTGETALLTVLTPGRDRGMCLERVETPQPLRLSVTPGRQLPLHAGASQKVLLAYLPDEDVERVIAAGLEHLCHATITDPQQLRDELATIRRRGWASSYEETNLGVGDLEDLLREERTHVRELEEVLRPCVGVRSCVDEDGRAALRRDDDSDPRPVDSLEPSHVQERGREHRTRVPGGDHSVGLTVGHGAHSTDERRLGFRLDGLDSVIVHLDRPLRLDEREAERVEACGAEEDRLYPRRGCCGCAGDDLPRRVVATQSIDRDADGHRLLGNYGA